MSPSALTAAVQRTPLAGVVTRVTVPEGASLATFVATAFPVVEHRRFVVVLIDGEEVPEAEWARVARAGEMISLVFRPGGKDFLRTVLQLAVIAVAAWVSGGALGPWAAAGTWQAAVAAAGVAIVGNLAINALVPLKLPGQLAAPDPFYSVTGARNSMRPWESFPILFGRHRIVPALWGKPVQETIGDKVFLRYALALGVCPMAVADWKVGETALDTYAGVEMEVRLNESDPPHTLYPGDPEQTPGGALLNHTTWSTLTTATNVDEIEIVYGFRGGLGAIDSKNRKVSKSVSFHIEYRPTGSSEAWRSHRADVPQANAASDIAGVPYRPEYLGVEPDLDEWVTGLVSLGGVASGPYTVTRADPGRGFQRSVRFAVPRGQYDVRTMRTIAQSGDSAVSDGAWLEYITSIRSYVDPFPNRKIASAVIRVLASDQLNGVIDTINCFAESLQPVFSSEALADPAEATADSLEDVEASSNPGVLGLALVRGPHNRRPKPDGEIDWPAWADFTARCEALDLTFNEYVTGKVGRWEQLRRICAAGYGRPVKRNGRLSVVMDRPRDEGEPPAQVFSARNVRGLRWSKTFPREVHGLRVQFANEDNGYQADEITVYLPGWTEETATIFETLPVPGKTNADEVRTVANQYARNAFFQTESFEFETDAEYLAVTRGAYVVIQHTAMATGLGSARVISRELNGGGQVTAVVLDAPVLTEAGPSLAMQWRAIKVEGASARLEVMGEVAITRDAANPRRFVFGSPLAAGSAPLPPDGDEPGDLAIIGEATKVSIEALVTDIEPRPHLQAAIRCVAYAGERFVDAPDWPAHNPKVTLPFGARPPAPEEIETAARPLEIAVAFDQPALPAGLELVGFEQAVREFGAADDTWTPLATLRPDERVAVAPAGDPGAKYDMRIVTVARRADGVLVRSDPLIVSEITASTAPLAPAGCGGSFAVRTSSGGAKQLVLTATWTPNEDTGVIATVVEQRIATGPDDWREIGRGNPATGKTEIHGLPVGRDYVLGFTNLSRRGAPSSRTVIASISAPNTLVATGAIDVEPGGGLGDALDDLAAADAALDAAVDAADARLDDAEDTLGLHGTAIGELETVTEGHATRISGLQAVSGRADASIVPNAAFGDYPNPTGLAAGWSAWNTPTAERTAGVVSPYSQFVEAAAGVAGGFARTLAAEPGLYAPEIALKLDAGTLAGAGVLIQFLNGAATVFHSESFVLASIPDVNGLVSTNNGSWRYFRPPPIEFPAGTASVTLYGINHYATFGSIAAMNQIHWAQLDLRPVSHADIGVGEAKASITEIEDVQADHDSALAALDSRLDVTEDDIDDVTGDVATLNAANLVSRMAAVDGGVVSAKTLAQVRATAEAARLDVSTEFPDGLASLSASFTGLPAAMADLTGSAYSLQTVDGQNVIQVAGYAAVYAKMAIRVRPNRVWEIEVEVRQTVADPDAGQNRVWMFARCLGASYNNLGTALNNDAGADIATGDGWVKRTWRFTNNSALSGEVETYDALSGVTFLRPWIQFNSISGAGTQQMRALRVRDITAEFGAATANASVTDLEEAVADEVSARAAFQTTAEADIGALEATATTQGGAIADLNGGSAWIESVVSAGGGDLGAFRLRAGKAGSFIELISTVLRLANVSNGAVIEVMRAIGGEAYFSRPISSDGGGKRVTIGPGYGVSGSQVVLWFGADSVAPSAQSRTNGYFALGTDGKVYYGAAEITAPTINDATKTGTVNFDNVTTSGTTLHTIATIDLTVGASGYLELMSPLFFGPLSINQETGMTLSAGTDWYGQMIVTEQLQSGGTEHTLWTIPLQISDTGGGLFDFIFDPPPNPLVAQNVSGASRYRLKLQRTSGSNNVSGNGLQGKFTIRRTP